MEILVGLTVLGLAIFTFAAYTQAQRKGLNRSNHFADGSRAAASALQSLKGQLADSGYFASVYVGLGSRPEVRTSAREVNGMRYAITLTLARAPAPLYGIKARARAAWSQGHSVEIGLLYPGISGFL